MLRVDGLRKSYGERTIFDGLSFELGVGAYALQGANGVGKSTLLALLAGAEPADGGDITIEGCDLRGAPLEARRRLSYAPDESPVYPFMTGREFLDFVAMIKKAPLEVEALRLAERFGLHPYFETRFSELSLGSQKKFLLCAAWIGEPRVMLLDEPSNGLDIAARDVLAALFREHARTKTIFFASHDAEFIASATASIVTMESLLGQAHMAA